MTSLQLKNSHHALRTFLIACLLLWAGVGGDCGSGICWGQTDFSGAWFIVNEADHGKTVENRWYMVPAKNPSRAHYADAYFNDQYCNASGKGDYTGSNYGDPEKPFLTTYKTSQDANSIWDVTDSGDGYYYIRHRLTGKYVIYQPPYKDAVNRKSVHLETLDAPGENAKFAITGSSLSGPINIRPASLTSGNRFLNPAGNNANQYNSGGGDYWHNGMIGVYSASNGNSQWYFEAVPKRSYTYNIVDTSGRIAIKYTTAADQSPGVALSGYASIPEDIRSPYISGEELTFYTFSGDYSSDNLTDENKTTITPMGEGANIYITYKTEHLTEKFLHLSGSRAFNIKVGGNYLYDDGSSTPASEDTDANAKKTSRLWFISGSDPYAVQIQNASTNRFLAAVASSLTMANDAARFILMDGAASGDGSTYEQKKLVAAVGGTDYSGVDFQAWPVSLTVQYYLIDKARKLIAGPLENTSSALELPAAWRSPLVSAYHYYKTPNQAGDTYAPSDEIFNPIAVGDGGSIYVTYDVGTAVDITGAKPYLLKFSDGESFRQENGSDGVLPTATKAIYPYNNGDFHLYVYGQEQWDAQLANGASTRSRWLWYFKSHHDGTDLTGAAADPYHVIVKSYQNQSLKVGDDSHRGSTYLRTYQPDGTSTVVTGVAYENLTYPNAKPSAAPTEYMLLGTSLQAMTLVTCSEVEGQRRTVDSFEQYWKNNPTARNLLDDAGQGVGTQPVDYELSAVQQKVLTDQGWRTYWAWANAAAWNNDANPSKKLANGRHWFQTVSMGSGQFSVEEVSLAPQVILLDQHGWEVMRTPLDDAAALRRYDSPMVETYHWHPTAVKATGYHKYTVSSQDIVVYDASRNDTGKRLQHNSTSLADSPYDHFEEQGYVAQDDRVKTDFYVTYTVNNEYKNSVRASATEDETSASTFLVRQGGQCATISGSSIVPIAVPAMEDVTDDMEWYVKPNFNIDREMGYRYAGEAGAQLYALTKAETDAANYSEGRNGFDPYNVQLQSKANPLRYFTANTSGSRLSSGAWTGTSSAVSLQNISVRQTVEGYNHIMLNITNATFMVVDDGNGNMRLMPRFDQQVVMQSFTTLAKQNVAAPVGDHGTAAQSFALTSTPRVIHSSDEFTTLDGSYMLADGFTFSAGFTSLGTADAPFTGSIDGQLNTIAGTLTVPLVGYASGATIKNVIFEDVSISGTGNTGAIAAEAVGATRIYNCGILAGSVAGTAYTGGLVGLLDGEARVVNCFSNADITGGTHVGGIVGYNNVATTSANLKTMVMNCMFYGDITGGTNIAPVYNGKIITNRSDQSGVGNYNYFRAEAPYAADLNINTTNCALMAETRFLQRFEFFRHLLNSNRELAAWWVAGNSGTKDIIAKWVLEPSQLDGSTPYPVLRASGKYASVVNVDADNASDYSERNKGGKMGTLTVNIEMGSGGKAFSPPAGAAISTDQVTLNITDKDPDHFNFNYHKVQLPYYNDVGTNNYRKAADGTSRVVTGWKITSITGGTKGTYATGADITYDGEGNIDTTPYNFADRLCTDKDLYSVSGRVFNQGAYWDVPEGVTEITIQPYWAKAVYLADAYADVVYNQAMTSATNVTTVGGGQRYTNGSAYSINGEEQTVYTKTADSDGAISKLGITSTNTVYDYAVVLVGNYHSIGISSDSANQPFTFMSADLDFDNEPDNTYILRFNSRNQLHPVRVDFINIPGLGMAQKSTGGTGSYNFGIMQPIGWFESTNTSLFRVTQFEYDRSNRTAAPYILQGGVIEQWVSGQSQGVKNQTTYFHVGGNVWFKEFHRGTHQDNTYTSKHPPVSVTGGDFDESYLTGLYRGDISNYADNAECYVNGGRFGIVAGAAMEGIGKARGADGTGNVTWQLQHADISEFYGGGINAAHPVEGNITTLITGGKIGLFCGGPKFGDMSAGKKVVTTATGCEFGTFFGAGYGGNSYSRRAPYNKNNVMNIDWNKWVRDEYTRKYASDYGGVETQINYQFLPMSGNADNVARLFVEYVGFSLATTHDVSSTLTGCTVTGHFYGGGSLGKVDGPAFSTLTDCTVEGNVYGAGFSASLPTVEVDSIGFRTEPYYYQDFGTYRTGVKGQTTTYTWQHGDVVNSTGTAIDQTNHILYTTADLTALGTVAGDVTLTITGDATDIHGDVYGGGALANSNTDYYKATEAVTATKTTVNLMGGTVRGNVYGGGQGRLAEAAVGTEGSAGYKPAVEAVAALVGNTVVNLNGTDPADNTTWVANDARGCVVKGSIFGCNNLNGTPKGSAEVHIFGTQHADKATLADKNTIELYEPMAYSTERELLAAWITKARAKLGDEDERIAAAAAVLDDSSATSESMAAQIVILEEALAEVERALYDVAAVYGGGNLAAYDPASPGTDLADAATKVARVYVYGCDRSCVQYVYGGGNAAPAPATHVTINGGTFDYVFGGGNGAGADNPGANVGYYTFADAPAHGTVEERRANYSYGAGVATTAIYGGQINHLFGGSNSRGNIRTEAHVIMDDNNECDYLMGEVYGGGNEAEMDGTINLDLRCIPGFSELYGGAKAANINGDIALNITCGTFTKVFGGNNDGGCINGKITVNIEETGCQPIVIGELYGCGNKAAYSIYGYDTDGEGNVTLRTSGESPQENPTLNIVSCTSIGSVFGGGYGAEAVVVGNPTVNINEIYGKVYVGESGSQTFTGTATTLGTIGTVFGGGNAAAVQGDTYVNIGTEETVTLKTGGKTTETVLGAHVTGNVYGGGNNADVSGKANVTIGKRKD